MPQRRVRRGRIGGDGLTDRERLFATEFRKDPAASYATIAKKAGFLGTRMILQARGRDVMKKAAVRALINAPDMNSKIDDEVEDEGTLKLEMRKLFLRITRSSNAEYADKIRAADKLLCTIQGGYVPVQVDMKGKMTMEAIVRAMGGAPEEPAGQPLALPELSQTQTQEGADA